MSSRSGPSPRPSPAPQPLSSGAEAVVQTLRALGVEVVFGLTGGAIMPLYDALDRDGAIRPFSVGHEQAGVHMAQGFARATGRPGVVLATSGPGATNLVTGLADAMLDSTPVVALTGQVPTNLLGRDSFQEADLRGLSGPVTKHFYRPGRAEELPDVLAEAFYLAGSGRPGPVVVDLPKDILLAPAEARSPRPPRLRGYRPAFQGHPLQVERALGLLRAARRPVLLVGGGVVAGQAGPEVRALAEALDLPVASTLMGLGGFPAGHRLWLGLAGMHGSGAANLAIHHADLLLALGVRFSDRLTGRLDRFAPLAKLVHVDIDAAEIGKNLPAQVPIVGHVQPVAAALLQGVRAWEGRPDPAGWSAQVQAWRAAHPLPRPSDGARVAPHQILEELAARLEEEDIVTTGVGQHQMWTAQFYPFTRPRTFITSGGLGTMGFGLPAALGAQVARPERRVVCVDGDGSFLMNIQELATAVRYRLPVVTLIMNNGALGMVRQWQRFFLEARYAETGRPAPPYDRVARAFGALGRRVAAPEELGPALDWALAASRAESRPAVLDVQIDPDCCVLPMVPPGQGNADFMEEAR